MSRKSFRHLETKLMEGKPTKVGVVVGDTVVSVLCTNYAATMLVIPPFGYRLIRRIL